MRPVDWHLSLAGLLIGLLVGMTGMGGGSLMTPLLVLVFGFKPTVAIGTDILHGAIFKSFGAWRHRSLGTVHARLTFLDAAREHAGLGRGRRVRRPGSSTVTATASRKRRRRHPRAGSSCGLGFLVKTFVTGREKTDAPFLLTRHDKVIALLTGLVRRVASSGHLSGRRDLVRAGASARLSAHRGEGGRHRHLPRGRPALGGRRSHLVAGNVDLGATAWLLVGSIPGVLIGSNVSVKLPDRVLRLGLATTLTLAGIKLAGRPRREACDHRRALRHRGGCCSPSARGRPPLGCACLARSSPRRREPTS